MGAFVFCIFFVVIGFITSLVAGVNYASPAGWVAIFLIVASLLASVDLCRYLMRGPLNPIFSALMRARELGGLLTVITLGVAMGFTTGGVIWCWASVAHQPFEWTVTWWEAVRHGFSCAVICGILAAFNFPMSFSGLAKLAERHTPRE